MEGGRKRKDRVFMGGLYLTPNPTTLGREGAVGRERDEGGRVINWVSFGQLSNVSSIFVKVMVWWDGGHTGIMVGWREWGSNRESGAGDERSWAG